MLYIEVFQMSLPGRDKVFQILILEIWGLRDISCTIHALRQPSSFGAKLYSGLSSFGRIDNECT